MSKSKTLLTILIVIFALSMVLVGCGRKNKNQSSGISSDHQNSTQQNSAVPDTDGNTSATEWDDNTSSEDYPLASALEDTIENVYNDLMNGADDWLSAMDEETMKTAYDMDFSNFDEYYGRIPKANVHATSIIGVKVKNGKKEEARAELMKYQAAMEQNFERYLPDQYDLVKDYRIIENGDYMVLVIADNADDIETAFGDAFDKMK